MAQVPVTSTTLLRNISADAQHYRWGEFVRRYQPMMEDYLRVQFSGLEAEDIVSETLVALAEALKNYRYAPDETGRFHNNEVRLLEDFCDWLESNPGDVSGGCLGFPRFCTTGTWRGRPYLVEELLEPHDLPRTDCASAKYLLAICRSVSELHKRGVVHRDLKPSNILFRANGEPVIVDLGLAKCPAPTGVESDASLENGKPIGVGTPGYAAPEQFIGGGISPAADIHALGVLAEKIVMQKEWSYS